MSRDISRRSSTVHFGAPDLIPNPPPLPAPRPLQRARDAATRLFGYQSRPPSPQEEERFSRGSRARFASLTATQNATASHKTGLEIRTLAINEEGTHALLGGKEIFKTIKVEGGTCTEELNLRSAIRSNPKQASGKARQVYSIDIADVAWAKGDCGNYVAAATSSGKIILYDLGHAGLPAAQLHEHFRQVHKVTFNPHRGSLLLSGSQDGTVRLWDVRDVRLASTLKSKHKYSGQSDGIRDVKWSPTDGVDFAFGTDSGWIQRWDMRNLKTAKLKVPAHSTTCNTIDWHPDGKHIVSASADKTVRVWDFSVSRKQKAIWEIKTPYPVLNARWRPACESSMPGDYGARQCTQLVTAYDQTHPVLHIWDFRRPALPFREMAPYPTAPTDLLWHSQDLLWTVGREGVFLQSDIQHAPKIIEKRNLQAFAVSPHGDINFVTQKRRRHPKQRTFPSFSTKPNASPEHSVFNRSWTDDTLDHSFLSALPVKRKEQSRSKTRTQSLSMASSSEQLHIAAAIIPLDEILLVRKSFRPIQIACRGIMPGRKDALMVSYLARKYKIDLEPVYAADDFLKAFEELMDHNARCTDAAGFYRLAQSWRIISFIATSRLKERADFKRKLIHEGKPQTQIPITEGSLGKVARRLLGEDNKLPIPTPASMRPVSALSRQLALSDSPTSHQTPLARPLLNSKASNQPIRNGMPDLDKDEHPILPPLISPAPSHFDERINRQSQHDRRLTISNLDGLQRFHQSSSGPNRSDMVRIWSVQPKEPLSLDPADANGVKIPPKLEKRDSDESFAFLGGSVESRGASFPSSLASTGSGPMQMVSERPSRTMSIKGAGTNEVDTHNHVNGLPVPPAAPLPQHENMSARPGTSHTLTGGADRALNGSISTSVKEEAQNGLDSGPGSYADEWGICPVVEQATTNMQPRQAAKPSVPLLSPPFVDKHSKLPDALAHIAPTEDTKTYLPEKTSSPYLPEDGDIDLEEDKPFTFVEMLREVMGNYAKKGDAQMAAHMVLLLVPLLPRTHPLSEPKTMATVTEYVDYFTSVGHTLEDIEVILDRHIDSIVASGIQPHEAEAILSTYHEQLIRLRLFNEAAIVRKLCFPTFPAVYDQTLKDNYVHLGCGDCGKPISTSMETLRCEICDAKPATCPICWCEESPYSMGASAANEQAKLLSTCLLCNHSGHAACLRVWFDECGEEDGGCPTEGCLCDCVAGAWRTEKLKMADRRRRFRTHGRVKSDDWTTQESRAVERTRDVLGIKQQKGTGLGLSA